MTITLDQARIFAARFAVEGSPLDLFARGGTVDETTRSDAHAALSERLAAGKIWRGPDFERDTTQATLLLLAIDRAIPR